MNITCNAYVNTATDFFVLNKICTHDKWQSFDSPVTCILYIIQAVVAVTFSVVTAIKYNSLNILNFQIHISATSNTWWIIYFAFVSGRSVHLSVRYASRSVDPGVIVLELVLHLLELTSLGLIFNHQKKHRSSDQISSEIDNYSRSATSIQYPGTKENLCYIVGSCNAVLAVVFVAIIVAIILLEVTDDSPWNWFWLYVTFAMCLHLVIITLALRIVVDRSEDGPSTLMKVLLIMGVLLMTPVDIPLFVWNNCIGIKCVKYVMMTPYDFLIMLKIFSLGFFFVALKVEFQRLCQQCHWAALNEVQRLGI